jgi:hypothetical protein
MARGGRTNLLTINADDLVAYAKRFSAAGKEVSRITTAKLTDYRDILEIHLLREIPWKTGKLANSLEVKVINANKPTVRLEVTIGSRERPEVVVRSLLFGSGLYGPNRAKYPIEPVRAKVLAFSVGGEMVLAKRVMHPGIKPNNFMQKAWDSTAPQREAMAEAVLGELQVKLIEE